MSRLDRYLARKTLVAIVLITALLLAVVIGLDVILRLKRLLAGEIPEGASRALLIVRLYLYSIPYLLSPVLPLVTMAAVLLTSAASLKRNEFTALSASGISLHRSTRVLLLLALAIGVLDVWISDRVTPQLEGRRHALEDRLTGESRTGRIWAVEETGTHWYANQVILVPGSAPQIKEIIAAPADPERDLLHAERLVHREDRWFLTGPIVRTRLTPDGRRVREELAELPCTGAWSIPYGPAELSQKLVSRYAMTGSELLRRADSSRHGRIYLTHFYARLSRLVVPLLAVLLVLPLFVRFNNRDNLILASIKTIPAGLFPIAVMSVGAMEADSASVHPLLVLTIATAIAAAPGIIAYLRWRL